MVPLGGQQSGRVERPGFCVGIGFRADVDRRAFGDLGGRVDSVVDGRIWLPATASAVLHGIVDHAAKDQSGRAGIDARQDGTGDWQLADVVGVGQGLAAGVQPRLAGRQAAAV